MAKNKHKRFAENETFKHLFQPSAQEMYEGDFHLKGKWNSDFFKNNNPITLEVGCGKGEYTTALAMQNPNKNYIGIDIKGPRLWTGSKIVQEKGLKNVAFIRNKVEFLTSFFKKGEISEIWITFPDPQRKKLKKRLTSARFLKIYSEILTNGGAINLKTDSVLMYEFTKRIIELNNLETIFSTNDLYSLGLDNELTQIQTYYEKKFLEQNMKITYIKFLAGNKTDFENPEHESKLSE
ncbi:MAG: tRNA (guanosine(46)-N7)-methyltransferase TrmB [Chlorobi bacterium]|nr:tRNA (guanosine(46)-N7)-methyltransferase TrmB [Chlorobiota bacterium]